MPAGIFLSAPGIVLIVLFDFDCLCYWFGGGGWGGGVFLSRGKFGKGEGGEAKGKK